MAKKRITKKTREDAILVCQVAASNFGVAPQAYMVFLNCLDVEMAAIALATDAWYEVHCRRGDIPKPWTAETDAEAECLLREGWAP